MIEEPVIKIQGRVLARGDLCASLHIQAGILRRECGRQGSAPSRRTLCERFREKRHRACPSRLVRRFIYSRWSQTHAPYVLQVGGRGIDWHDGMKTDGDGAENRESWNKDERSMIVIAVSFVLQPHTGTRYVELSACSSM